MAIAALGRRLFEIVTKLFFEMVRPIYGCEVQFFLIITLLAFPAEIGLAF